MGWLPLQSIHQSRVIINIVLATIAERKVKMKNQILPNGGISDPHFLRVHRNLRFPVRIRQLYRDNQQLQLKMMVEANTIICCSFLVKNNYISVKD